MPAPTIYRSSDASAPVLDGTAGSLIAVLDACLVNGYGAKAAAGWTKPFSGTNTAVYLGTAGHYLDVNDNGAGSATTQEATVRGYESMTAVATGTNPFPTVAQQPGVGLYIRKSAAATSAARGWLLVADGTTFYLFVLTGDNPGLYFSFVFGRFYSFKSGDVYRSLISGRISSGSSVSGFGPAGGGTPATSAVGLFLARSYTGTVGAVLGSQFAIGTTGSGWTAPNPADGLTYVSRLLLGEATVTAGLRGYFRGAWQLLSAVNMNDGDTFTGGGDFAGRTFMVVKGVSGTANVIALETSAWDSSA